ncbi:hypothetical protein HID58_069891 [Brassica napus]|uniref:Uncharacterized protein n=1 Tax=Brassica napus TaxID=3708 RepID=A0ABQ7YX62_BRANA|nr:hypothetical protein HID58_069891 [Brassica napus]
MHIAKTKKSSTSGGAKKEICLLLEAKFCATLCFFGAGGHVSISGIRDFLDIGVQHPLGDVDVAVEDIEVDDDVEKMGVPLIGFFPFDTIFKTVKGEEKTTKFLSGKKKAKKEKVEKKKRLKWLILVKKYLVVKNLVVMF